MSLRTQLGLIRGSILGAFYRRPVSLAGRGPLVSFTFDDFPRTAFSVGGAILERFGTRGTYYVAAGLTNTSNELGELFGENDLHSLLEAGHEVGSHTLNHSSCRSLSSSAFRAEVEKGVNAVEHLTACASINFSYPYGHFSLATKKALRSCVASARSILPGINGPEIDLNQLRANCLYGDIDVVPSVKNLILQSVERKGWLIFYTHDVRPKPSEYGCTPELFELTVEEAVRSGSRILTVQQVLAEVGVNKAVIRQNTTCSKHAD
jgi:peptidoglycan/xylan/chitin deacetylase (PgdA/CDA1 family)